jgi:hypothetical protein
MCVCEREREREIERECARERNRKRERTFSGSAPRSQPPARASMCVWERESAQERERARERKRERKREREDLFGVSAPCNLRQERSARVVHLLPLCPVLVRACKIEAENLIKSSFSIALMCTPSHRIPASASSNHGPEKGHLILL